MAATKPKAFWPLTITAGVNDRIDLKIGATPYVATVAPGTYDHPAWYSGETTTSLNAAIVTALSAAVSNGWVNGPGASGRWSILGTSAFSIQWATGPNLARSIGSVLGFDIADLAAATSQTAQHQHQNGWYAVDPPLDDTRDVPSYVRSQAQSLGGTIKSLDFTPTPLYDRTIQFALLPASKTWKADEGAAALNEALERLFDAGWARFRWWADTTNDAAYGDYALAIDKAKAFQRKRLSPGNPLYAVDLVMKKHGS